jgi:hypothetical protein
MFGVDRKIVGVLFVDPGGTQWQGGALKPFPFVEHDTMPKVFLTRSQGLWRIAGPALQNLDVIRTLVHDGVLEHALTHFAAHI